MDDFNMVGKTLAGLEPVLASELNKLGAKDTELHSRAVSFRGDKGFLYKANFCCRTALRILVPIHVFEVHNENDLYEGIKGLDWEKYISPENTLAVDTSLNTSLFTHSQYISQKVKDGVADRFREKTGKRPSVDKLLPDLKINIHISRSTCTVSLDSSGQSLHKRGYRTETGLAPISEVLAAGLVLLSGWDKKSVLIDPMCGSGTIVTEAALIAANIPPGFFRKEFGFERWKDFDADLWKTMSDAAISKINNEKVPIIAVDVSRNVIRKAKKNIHEANVSDLVQFETAAFSDYNPPQAKGVLIMNPPYGERMDKDDITVLYKEIGDTFKKKYSGYDCWIISSNMEALKNVGLRPSRKIKVFNGQLECRFMKYSMYAGAKKDMYEITTNYE